MLRCPTEFPSQECSIPAVVSRCSTIISTKLYFNLDNTFDFIFELEIIIRVVIPVTTVSHRSVRLWQRIFLFSVTKEDPINDLEQVLRRVEGSDNSTL